MEAVCSAVNFCFLKRKEPSDVTRNKASIAMILEADATGQGPAPRKGGV